MVVKRFGLTALEVAMYYSFPAPLPKSLTFASTRFHETCVEPIVQPGSRFDTSYTPLTT
jgi:hypothetical protein